MKRTLAVLCTLLLCCAAPLASAERVLFEAAGFSVDIPIGWRSQDIADGVKELGQTIVLNGEEIPMLGHVMIGDEQGLLLISCTVLERPEGYDIAGELAYYVETYADVGEDLDVDGHSFFRFYDGNMRYAYGFTDDKIFIIYAETLNEAYAEQFDTVVKSITFE